jgi:methionyl-tRNA formyltransferase
MTTHATPALASPLRIVMMGTPEFAVPTLVALHDHAAAHHWEVIAVVTQPDRPAGRGNKVSVGPVKQQALAYGLPIQQPATLRKDAAARAALAALAPDLLVVAAYGLILPRSVLELPTYGAINVHASLLPAYRGASPITTAILDGLETTGVSIMLMDEGMDTGPVLTQAAQPIRADDTTATLSTRLAAQGAQLLVETLPRWLAGDLAPIPQAQLPGAPSLCRLIKKEQGAIDWQQPAAVIERMTRAYAPWPSAYTHWRGEPFKVIQADVIQTDVIQADVIQPDTIEGTAAAGQVVNTPRGPAVGTGAGLLLLRQVQPAGKRVMDAASWLNGAPDALGTILG